MAQRALDKTEPGVRLSEFNAVNSALRKLLRAFGNKLYDNDMSVKAEQWDDRPWEDESLTHTQWLSERRSRINAAISQALGRPGKKIYGMRSITLTGRVTQHQILLVPES